MTFGLRRFAVVLTVFAAVVAGVLARPSPEPGAVGAIASSVVDPVRCAALNRRSAALGRQVGRARRAVGMSRTRRDRRAASVRLTRLVRARRSVDAGRRAACSRAVSRETRPAGPVAKNPAPASPGAGIQPLPVPVEPVVTVAPSVPPEIPGVPAPGARAVTDRPDDFAGPDVHLVYVLPADGIDRARDTEGAIGASFAATQRFLVSAGGVRLRLDTYRGVPDISFHRMDLTDEEAAASGPFVRERIEESLIAAGFGEADTLLLVYYEGRNTAACGSAAWPPDLTGTVGALYLHGTPGGFACDSIPLAGPGEEAGYWEHSAAHEALHLMGVVPGCAPHAVLSGHVSDSPRDLMYAGPRRWAPETLDVGRDDYFRASVPGCPDLSTSPYLEPAT